MGAGRQAGRLCAPIRTPVTWVRDMPRGGRGGTGQGVAAHKRCVHCGLQTGNLRDAGEPPQGFDGCCGGQAVAGAVFGGGAAGGMKVVGEARPGDVKQGAGERLQPVKEGRDAAQVFAKGGVGEGEQDLVSVAPKPQLAGVAAGLKKASECGFAGGAPAVFESFGGGCGAQGGQARRRRAGRFGFDRLLRGRLGAGGGGARDLGSTCVLGRGRRRWGEGEAARGRAGRRRGRASKRGRRCCK